MDIRETLLELINSETIRYSYMAVENYCYDERLLGITE